jgi:hypothetical protein
MGRIGVASHIQPQIRSSNFPSPIPRSFPTSSHTMKGTGHMAQAAKLIEREHWGVKFIVGKFGEWNIARIPKKVGNGFTVWKLSRFEHGDKACEEGPKNLSRSRHLAIGTRLEGLLDQSMTSCSWDWSSRKNQFWVREYGSHLKANSHHWSPQSCIWVL